MEHLTELREKIRIQFGSLSKLGTDIGVNKLTVVSWFTRGVVPAEKARLIHDKHNNIKLWEIRPDLWKEEEFK